MGHDLDSAARERLNQYIDTLGVHLKDRRKRESFAIYAAGVLASAERKSVEPIAALASGDAATTRHITISCCIS
jgi:SRSO17 transposase